MHPYYKQLGQRLKNLRHSRGLTQQELAEKAGLTTAFLSYLENGSRKGSLDAYLALGGALSLDADALFASDVKSRAVPSNSFEDPMISLEGLSPYDTRSVLSVVRSLRRRTVKKKK